MTRAALQRRRFWLSEWLSYHMYLIVPGFRRLASLSESCWFVLACLAASLGAASFFH